MKSIFMAMCAALMCGGLTTAYAQKNIPQSVKDAFTKAYPSVTKVKWEKENAGYEAFFTSSGHKMSAVFSRYGVLTETETIIPMDALPEPVLQYAQSKGQIAEAARIEKANGAVLYEAEVNGKDLLFDDKGTLILRK